MSGALITARADDISDVPGKLRLLAASSTVVLLRVDAKTARDLANRIEAAAVAEDALETAAATMCEQRAVAEGLSRHLGDSLVLLRLWMGMAIAATAVAGVAVVLAAL